MIFDETKKQHRHRHDLHLASIKAMLLMFSVGSLEPLRILGFSKLTVLLYSPGRAVIFVVVAVADGR